jgi:oligoendopeptidase F
MPVWNLDDIIRPADRESLKDGLKADVAEFKKYRRRLDAKPTAYEFVGMLKKHEELSMKAGRLEAYAGLRLAENTADQERCAHEAVISQLCADLDNDTMFLDLWFKGLADDEAEGYIKASGGYRHMLERIRVFRPHILGESEERIINLKDLTGAEASVKLYDIITGKYRFAFEGMSLSYDEISHYKLSPMRAQRKEAYDATLDRFAADEEVLGEIYRSVVNDLANETVKMRNYKSPLSAANLGNDIPDGAVDALLSVVRDERGVFQEYFRLKAKLCGEGGMDRYDLYVPYPALEREYPFEDCMRMTLETFRGFDESMHAMAKMVFDGGHIHSELTANKQPGAFCHTVVHGTTPYVMLNHVGRLEDLYTMAHEIGHCVHSLAAKGHTEFTYRPALPLAETASIFAEMLLTKKLIEESVDGEKAALLARSLDRQYATITRQAYFTLFEIEAHGRMAAGATVGEIDALYLENLREQFAGSMAVPEIFRHEWKSIQHIYYSPFYCYSYAFGNLLVLALYRLYEKEGGAFIPKYLKVLAYGGSESPSTILEEIGLDMTKSGFWKNGFDAIREEIRLLKGITG